MGSSVIGALRVDLGLNSAQFTAGLTKAQSGLVKFGKTAALGLAAVATAAAAAGIAMGLAVKHAIDHADALGKAAQKAGVTVTALSRLEYAAKLSDVSLEGLTSGLEKLGRSMADAAQGKGPAAAFKALGIAVKDGTGNLRDSNVVFADVADRFSRMEDGALKTALAVQIFGKSGADLIPLLNEGRTGLQQMADESDRLGITISGKTAAAAEKFNDTLTRVGAIMQGVVNKVMEAALPALQSFADTLASPEFASAAQSLATAVITALDRITQAITAIINGISGVISKVNEGLALVNQSPAERSTTQLNSDLAWHQGKLSNPGISASDRAFNEKMVSQIQAQLAARASGGIDLVGPGMSLGPGQTLFDALGGTSGTGIKLPPIDASGVLKSLEPVDLGIQKLTEHVTTLAETMAGTVTDAFTGFVDAIMSGVSPLQAFGDELANIGKQLLHAGIQSLIGNLFGAGKTGFTGNFNIGGMPLYADGTNYHPGGMAIVGENGPELVNLPRGSSVTPNGKWGGGETVVRVELGPELVGRVLKQAADQSVQIVRAQAPAAVAVAQRNRIF